VNPATAALELGEDREVKIPLAAVIQRVIGLENAGLPIPIGKLLEGRGTSKPNRTRRKVSCVGADGKSRGSHAKLF
jgi:hypothetical protein